MTGAFRHFSHYLNLGVDLLIFGFAMLYIWHQSLKRRQQLQRKDDFDNEMAATSSMHWYIYGPTYLVCLSSLLILADPVRHVLQDLGYWRAPMYISGCPIRALQLPERACTIHEDCGTHGCGNGYFSVNPGEDCFTCWQNTGLCSEGAETFRCLSWIGWMVTVVATYVGFALFFVGVLWNANLMEKLDKISRQWRALQRRR